jgi:hypothetical protein
MVRFWTALQTAALSPAAGVAPAYINLQTGVGPQPYVLGEVEFGSIIVERPCYVTLWQLVINNWINPDNPQHPDALILGTPGIGKL